MRVEVRPLYECGKPLPKRPRMDAPGYRGKLAISENRLHALNRVVTCARLTHATDGADTPVLPELTDIHILWLEGESIRIRGIERVENAFYGQTWDIKVL